MFPIFSSLISFPLNVHTVPSSCLNETVLSVPFIASKICESICFSSLFTSFDSVFVICSTISSILVSLFISVVTLKDTFLVDLEPSTPVAVINKVYLPGSLITSPLYSCPFNNIVTVPWSLLTIGVNGALKLSNPLSLMLEVITGAKSSSKLLLTKTVPLDRTSLSSSLYQS